MPNAKRVLQDREAALKRYATYREQIAAYNANVDQVNAANQSATDLYNQQAVEYNAWMEQIKAGQSKGVAKTSDGKWALLGSHNGDYAWDVRDYIGNPRDAAQMYGSVAELNGTKPNSFQISTGLSGAWVRNPDGTASRYEWASYDEHTIQPGEAGYVENNGLQHGGWRPEGGVDPNYRPAYTGWVEAGAPVKIAEFNTKPPTTQGVTVPTPEEPKGWNPSLREIAELRAPTVDTAGAQMATARGEGAKTGLVNEAIGRESAFADPEDPNNLADKGILARVLGGQL